MLLYETIKQDLPALTSANESGQLPSERYLQDKYQSTRVTVREALIRLEAEGLIYRINRTGWFLCPKRLLWDPIKKVNFYQLAKEQGLEPKTEVLSCEQQKVAPDIYLPFELAANDDFYRIYRIRYLNSRPVMVEEIYCPSSYYPELEGKELNGSITTLLADDYNANVIKEKSDILVTALPDDKAEKLKLNGGASCLKIVRKRYNEQNQLVDYNLEYWLHSAIEMTIESN